MVGNDRQRGSGNVAIASGDLFPDGIPVVAANPDVQATVRPAGWMFRKSAGFETVRPGRTRFQDGFHGLGIHFTPHRYAEDIGQYGKGGLPLLVDKDASWHHADIADLPGSDRLDDEGKLTAQDAATNAGPKLSEGRDFPTGSADVRESEKLPRDMGDRERGRPMTREFYERAFRNPAGLFREEYSRDPLKSVAIAGAIVGVVYMVSRDFERAYRRRRGSTVVGAVAAAPAAATDTAGNTVAEATQVANRAATAAGQAASEAASAAGDVAQAAGAAVEEVTEAVADAASGKD